MTHATVQSQSRLLSFCKFPNLWKCSSLMWPANDGMDLTEPGKHPWILHIFCCIYTTFSLSLYVWFASLNHGNKFHSCFMCYCGHCNKTKLWRLDSDFIGLNIRFLLSLKGFYGHQIPNSYRRYNTPKGKPLEIHPETSRDPPTFIQFLRYFSPASYSSMQLPCTAVGWIMTSTVHDTTGTIDEGSIARVHAIVHPLLPYKQRCGKRWGGIEINPLSAKFRSVDKRAFGNDSLHA